VRAQDFITEAPRDVFHFVGQSHNVPRPTGSYYKWRVSLSNGQYYNVRAGANTDLEKFKKYFARKWGTEMPDVEVVKAERLERLSEEDSQKKCPPATQDITINLENRQKAIDEYGYGPLNPDMPNRKFWMAKVDEWNLDSAEEAKQSLCGNCAAFDQRQATLDCIAQGIDSDNPEDAEGVIDAGELGYCKFLKFKCASRRTCDAWVTGGPLTDQQDVDEMAGKVHGGIRKELHNKGYRYLGGGIDKQAYLEPGTGQVLVVFGYSKWAKGGSDFSVDQRMFVDWAKYCKKNQANPHLPRFSDWASFDYQGKRYLQIRMEPLQELPDRLKMLVADLEEVAKYSKSNPKTAYKKIATFANHNLLDAGEIDDLDHKEVVKRLGGEQAANALLKTVYDVKKFGKQHGFNIDLHGGNYMQRADGTIVVNDPFVATFF